MDADRALCLLRTQKGHKAGMCISRIICIEIFHQEPIYKLTDILYTREALVQQSHELHIQMSHSWDMDSTGGYGKNRPHNHLTR